MTDVFNYTVANGVGAANEATSTITINITGTDDNVAPVLYLGGGSFVFGSVDYTELRQLGRSQRRRHCNRRRVHACTRPACNSTHYQIKLTDLDSEVGVPDLLSRTINLSGATSATVTFDYRRDIPSGQTDDQFLVLASSDGVNFTQIGQIGATGNGSFVDAAYQTFTFDLTPLYFGEHDDTVLRWR